MAKEGLVRGHEASIGGSLAGSEELRSMQPSTRITAKFSQIVSIWVGPFLSHICLQCIYYDRRKRELITDQASMRSQAHLLISQAGDEAKVSFHAFRAPSRYNRVHYPACI